MVQALCAHFARDRLTTEELDSRLERAQKASADGQLAALVVDLPSLADHPLPWASTVREEAAMPVPYGQARLSPPAMSASSYVDVPRPASRKLFAMMSEFKRVGSWLPPQQLDCTAVMAEAVLDFREAQLAPGVTEVHVTAVMAEARIIAPPDLRIEVDGSAFMGSFDAYTSSVPPKPGAPILRITGFAFMGAVRVDVRFPGESRRDAKRRERELRRIGA